jgi:BA14K-like protein
MMISLKMLSTAAALALLVPMTAPTASFAEGPKIGRGGPAVHANVGGGAPAMRMGSGAPAVRMGGGAPAANFAASAPAARPDGNVAWSGNRAGWSGAGRTAWNGGGGGAWRGDGRRHDGRWWPGAVAAGAVIGGAIAANDAYAYYDGPAYYDQPAYYDDQYVDDGAVAVVPVPVGEDSGGSCAQRYRSYDPASGTYLGFDGLRHPCL